MNALQAAYEAYHNAVDELADASAAEAIEMAPTEDDDDWTCADAFGDLVLKHEVKVRECKLAIERAAAADYQRRMGCAETEIAVAVVKAAYDDELADIDLLPC